MSLPAKLPCNVLCDINRVVMGVQRSHTYDAGSFSLEKRDGKYSLTAAVDVVAASMLGKGTVRVFLAPVFPHAPVVDARISFDFNLPVDLVLDGVSLPEGRGPEGGDEARPAEIGDAVQIEPRIAKQLAELEGFVLKATIVEKPGQYNVEARKKVGNDWLTRGESRRENQKENTLEVLVWAGELKARTWVVGTARQDAYRYLTCYKAGEQGDYELEITLVASFDGGVTFAPLWTLGELGRGLTVKRPTLTSFKASVRPMGCFPEVIGTVQNWALLPQGIDRDVFVEGEIAGFSRHVGSLRWNLVITLWGAQPIVAEASAPKSAAKNAGKGPGSQKSSSPPPKEKPRLAVDVVATQVIHLDDSGRFELVFGLAQLPPSEWATKGGYPIYFATLAFDGQVTNTPGPQPITELISVDSSRFHLANPEDLFEGATPAQAVEVCSEGLPGDPICVPHVSSIRFAIEGEKLAVRYHLAGGAEYWNKAKLTYALVLDEPGEPAVELALEAKTPAGAPNVRLATIDMTDERILGKELEALVRVESPSIHEVSQHLRCAPELVGPISFSKQEDGSRRFFCGTRYVPTHVSAKVTTEQRLRFAFYEELANQRRIPLGYIRPKHDLPSGSGGLCAPSGLFGAILPDAKLLDEALKKGRVILVVESAFPDGKVHRRLGAPLSLIVEGSSRPRSVKFPIRFGKCVSASFKKKVIEVAGELTTPGCSDPATVADYLMTIMACETGGKFLAGIENPVSHAVGLIQFIINGDEKIQEIADHPAGTPSHVVERLTALGASTPELRARRFRDELKAMPPVVQLANVRNFLLRRAREASAAGTLEDYYCCVFFPAAVGKPDEYVIGAPGSAAAQQNPSLCVNGALLKGKVCQRIREWWAYGEGFIADETDDNPVSFCR